MQYFIRNKKINLAPKQMIGQGGEADIYAINQKEVIKLFKSPQHPAFANDLAAQKASKARIDEHQDKLKQFPQGLPSNVLSPLDFVLDNQGKIAGYTMPYLQDAQPLYCYGDRRFREQNGIDQNKIIKLFISLHQTIRALHQKNIVIGDFNDLNILINQEIPFLIDVDSWQFSQFKCSVFTARFVDPRLCTPNLNYLDLETSHDKNSDWYAYSLMLFRCLLYVELYGGVYSANQTSQKIPQAARPLHRITVFNAQVKYPKPAIHYRFLSDDLLQYYKKLAEQDLRGEFPLTILQNLQWQTCKSCGQSHCRKSCPDCASQIQPIALPQISGHRPLFVTTGSILATAFSDRHIAYLYWENGLFKRETGETIFQGDRRPDLQFWLTKEQTYVGQGNTVLCFAKGTLQAEQTLQVDRYRERPCFQLLGHKRYWLSQGKLWRDGTLGRDYLGDVLADQSYFWLGEKLGFGIYQMGHWLSGFIFDPHRHGINDQVKLPPIQGEIIAMNCVIDHHIWLFFTVQYQGQIQQHLYVMDAQGQGRSHEVFDPTTLPRIDGHWATPAGLLMTTDQGLCLWSIQQNKVTAHPFAEIYNNLVAGHQHIARTSTALYLYDSQHIDQLELQ